MLDLEKFNENGRIRFAQKKDIPAIMKFIEEYWASNHILAHDREIFEFQYVYGDEVCFVLNEDQETGEIDSVLGYIPYGTEGDRDIFTAIWKVNKSSGFMQGTELICYLEKYGRCKNLYCVGLATRVVSIMKYLRKKIADFDHYYRLNPAVKEYRIAEIHTFPEGFPGQSGATGQPQPAEKPQTPDMSEGVAPQAQFKRVSEFAQVEQMLAKGSEERFPYKTPSYVKRRYFEHPEYEYDKWHIRLDGKEALLVCRVQEAAGSRVYRVIDCLGDLGCIAGCGKLFEQIFTEADYEYADCLVCGMDESLMKAAGFTRKSEEDGNIIPNYFEPFEKRNVTIHNFMPKNVDTVMFKGDGDQDRPNFRKRKA